MSSWIFSLCSYDNVLLKLPRQTGSIAQLLVFVGTVTLFVVNITGKCRQLSSSNFPISWTIELWDRAIKFASWQHPAISVFVIVMGHRVMFAVLVTCSWFISGEIEIPVGMSVHLGHGHIVSHLLCFFTKIFSKMTYNVLSMTLNYTILS